MYDGPQHDRAVACRNIFTCHLHDLPCRQRYQAGVGCLSDMRSYAKNEQDGAEPMLTRELRKPMVRCCLPSDNHSDFPPSTGGTVQGRRGGIALFLQAAAAGMALVHAMAHLVAAFLLSIMMRFHRSLTAATSLLFLRKSACP